MRGSLAILVSIALLGGCVERRIWIESSPPGARVWLNGSELGRTPVDVSFTHEGTYDVRLELEGHEPLICGATTDGPIWDQPPLDFFAEVLPVDARNETRWIFKLSPRDDSESALVERAKVLRDRLTEGEAQRP